MGAEWTPWASCKLKEAVSLLLSSSISWRQEGTTAPPAPKVMKLSLFNKPISKWKYTALALTHTSLWYSFILLVMFACFPATASTKPDTSLNLAEAVAVFATGVVAAPLIENFIFTRVLKFFLHENPRSAAFISALIAAALHASFRSLIAFGIFYIIAAVYITNAKDNPRYAFWLGVLVHSISNIPGSTVPLLEVFGITEI